MKLTQSPHEPEHVSLPSERGAIHVTTFAHAGSVTLTVKDDGCGIPPHVQKTIFDAYPLCSIFIIGYSDDIGKPEYNLTLSQRRTVMTGTYVLKLGVPDSRLREFFFGRDYPVDSTDSPEARAKNRRVEFHVLNNPSP